MSNATATEATTAARVDEPPGYHDSQQVMRVPTIASTSGGAFSTTHKSALVDGSGKHEWLILRTTTKPRKPESLPIFETRDVIKGEVEMDSSQKSVNGMKSLTISIIGIATQLNHDPHKFLKQTQVLWTPALAPVSTLGQSGDGKSVKHIWPFSFTLPENIEVDGAECDIPPTLTLRTSPVSIEYRLTVQVKRQGIFNPSRTLTTPFGLRLVTCAEPPSTLRQVSLRDGGAVFSPGEDPTGWKVLPSVSVKGMLQGKTQPSEVELTLAISQPTTYPVGSPVPLFLTLKSNDSQALKLLATSPALGLELVGSISTASPQDVGKKGGAKKPYTEGEVFAVWWPAEIESTENATERQFHGELNVPASTIPSFVFPRCKADYTLDIRPPSAPGWTAQPASLSERPPPILSEPITIVAKQALGVPKARSAAPPGYKDESSANFRVMVKSFTTAGFV